MRAKCKSCFYFDPYDHENWDPGMCGYCRIRSPIVIDKKDLFGIFPTVFDNEWCGEWRADTKEKSRASHNTRRRATSKHAAAVR